MNITTANTILYCSRWDETVQFYRQGLQLPVTFANDWFVEFRLASTARLSIADEQRATMKSSLGVGITLTFQVDDADTTWQQLCARGLEPDSVRDHPWGARLFHLYDPEGNRLEIWSSSNA